MFLVTNYCADASCKTGSTCVEADGDYECRCPPAACPCANRGKNCDAGKICKRYNGT